MGKLLTLQYVRQIFSKGSERFLELLLSRTSSNSPTFEISLCKIPTHQGSPCQYHYDNNDVSYRGNTTKDGTYMNDSEKENRYLLYILAKCEDSERKLAVASTMKIKIH